MRLIVCVLAVVLALLALVGVFTAPIWLVLALIAALAAPV